MEKLEFMAVIIGLLCLLIYAVTPVLGIIAALVCWYLWRKKPI